MHVPTDLDSMNLDADEWSSDISNVTSVLKLWLRELPDPLFTSSQHADFLDAARTCFFRVATFPAVLTGLRCVAPQGTRTSVPGTSGCTNA